MAASVMDSFNEGLISSSAIGVLQQYAPDTDIRKQ
jgi:hypothetical protein